MAKSDAVSLFKTEFVIGEFRRPTFRNPYLGSERVGPKGCVLPSPGCAGGVGGAAKVPLVASLRAVIACDQMWAYQQVRRRDERQSLWMLVVEEADDRRWVDSEVGDRSQNTFERLYARLP